MPQSTANLPTKSDARNAVLSNWSPFRALHREIDRLFNELDGDFWRSPIRHPMFDTAPLARLDTMTAPVVDIAEKDNAYEITAELPGIEERDIDVKLSNGVLIIKGEKKAEKEEKKKDYYLSERSYGSFERSFSVPEGVQAEKVSATFKNGVLKIELPKSPEARKEEKKIAVKTA